MRHIRCEWVDRKVNQGHQPVLVHLTDDVISGIPSSNQVRPELVSNGSALASTRVAMFRWQGGCGGQGEGGGI